MKQLKFIVIVILFALLPAFTVSAQIAGRTTHFEKRGVAFDYPADWILSDNSTYDALSFVLIPKYGLLEIAISAQQIPALFSCDLQSAGENITAGLIKAATKRFQPTKPVHASHVTTWVGDAKVKGVRLRGLIDGRQATSEIYSIRNSLEVVSLVNLRVESESPSEQAWQLIRSTLKITHFGPIAVQSRFHKAALPATPGPIGLTVDHPPRPPLPTYPPLARMAHAGGKVVVQVLIDESGKVIAAHATSGHPLLQPAAIAAAKASKFPPTTMCGLPVRVAGILEYNFIGQ